MSSKFSRGSAAVAIAVLLLAVSATGQSDKNSQRPKAPPTLESGAPPATPAEDGDRPGGFRIGVKVDQVILNATVHDKEGRLVTGLTKDRFTIFEDKTQQAITNFSLVDMPSTIGLIVDTSGSMKNRVDDMLSAVNLFLESSNKDNELFLITFNDEVKLEEDLTKDVLDIKDGLNNIIVSGGTALYDAIHLGIDKAKAGSEPKKALVVFSDGEDRDSYYSHENLAEKIKETDVQVYIVTFLDASLDKSGGFFGARKSERQKVVEKMDVIAELTGGKSFLAETPESLPAAFKAIAHELRNQYRIAYISNNLVKDGKWRDIRVALNDPKLKIRAKRGYYAK
ncbi:MAG: VWA domain-containing protein [Acidobacteriota bacterium]